MLRWIACSCKKKSITQWQQEKYVPPSDSGVYLESVSSFCKMRFHLSKGLWAVRNLILFFLWHLCITTMKTNTMIRLWLVLTADTNNRNWSVGGIGLRLLIAIRLKNRSPSKIIRSPRRNYLPLKSEPQTIVSAINVNISLPLQKFQFKFIVCFPIITKSKFNEMKWSIKKQAWSSSFQEVESVGFKGKRVNKVIENCQEKVAKFSVLTNTKLIFVPGDNLTNI